MTVALEGLRERLRARKAVVAVIGLGYVGLPQALAFGEAGFRVIGFDIDPAKPEALNAGRSYLLDILSDRVGTLVSSGHLAATTDFRRVGECDAIIVCVPTPLSEHGEPDLSAVSGTASAIAPHLRLGQLVVLVSTTYPGTTEELVRPILEAHGLVVGRDIALGYSPEREDPGILATGSGTRPSWSRAARKPAASSPYSSTSPWCPRWCRSPARASPRRRSFSRTFFER